MNYTKVKVFTTEDMIEFISAFLFDKGIDGIEIEEPRTYRDFLNKQNSYDWDYVDPSLDTRFAEMYSCIIFYLEDNISGINLLDEVLDEMRAFDIIRVEISGEDDEDWKHKWKKYFKPTHITESIVVKPSWDTYEQKGSEIVIEIDPEMAFGTGTHPTTSLCIKLLEEYIDSEETKVLDIGCGSGILSIAAALLGAGEVLGIEIDPVAVKVAEKNVKSNRVDEKVRILQGDLTFGIEYEANVIVANLMAELIIELSKHISKHLKHGGVFIASGILTEKKEGLISAMERLGFTVSSYIDGEWCALVGKRSI